MLRLIPLPPGVPEALLFLIILSAIIGVIYLVRRRRRFARASEKAEVPLLNTEHRTRARFRRIYLDPEQGVWLAEAAAGKTGRRKIVFCLTDYERNRQIYDDSLGELRDIALYGMATLSAGGAEAMRGQIRDADHITEDAVRLIPAGQFHNDYVVIGRILSRRDDIVHDLKVHVYRVRALQANDLTLILELAADGDAAPLPDDSMTHGAARLYGYMDIPNRRETTNALNRPD